MNNNNNTTKVSTGRQRGGGVGGQGRGEGVEGAGGGRLTDFRQTIRDGAANTEVVRAACCPQAIVLHSVGSGLIASLPVHPRQQERALWTEKEWTRSGHSYPLPPPTPSPPPPHTHTPVHKP